MELKCPNCDSELVLFGTTFFQERLWLAGSKVPPLCKNYKNYINAGSLPVPGSTIYHECLKCGHKWTTKDDGDTSTPHKIDDYFSG